MVTTTKILTGMGDVYQQTTQEIDGQSNVILPIPVGIKSTLVKTLIYSPDWPGLNSSKDVLMPNFTIILGRTVYLTGTIISGNTPLDITSAVLRFTAKNYYTDPDTEAIIVKTSPSNGITILDGPTGQYLVTINPSDTNGLAEVTTILVYDVQVTLNKNVYSVVTGILTIDPNVSQTTP